MSLNEDWDKIVSCFTAMRQFTQPWQTYGVAIDRPGLVKLAAKLMKPRADTKRLESQINFVCFGE